MKYQTPDSPCLLCGRALKGSAVSGHLKTCLKKRAGSESGTTGCNAYHLLAENPYTQDYFLHLIIAEDKRLADLDRFLRDLWLDCCGHESIFTHDQTGDEISMDTAVGMIFEPGGSLCHLYDFRATTELIVTCIGILRLTISADSGIELIARNTLPIIPCDECGRKPAEKICTDCQDDGGGWLCGKCFKRHACRDTVILPVTNSPRSGICAYAGGQDITRPE